MVLSSLLGAAAGGGALVLVLMSARPPTVRVNVEPPRVTVEAPVAEEDDATEDEEGTTPLEERPVEHPVGQGCVADPELVGVPAAAGVPMQTVEPLVGATAAGCVIAAWSYASVYVSRDDGATFVEAVTGEDSVTDVAISDDGTVYAVLEEGTLAIARPDGTVGFRELPVELSRLVAGGHWLAGVAGGTVAVSSDGARSWRFRELPATDTPQPDSTDLSIEADGTLRTVSGYASADSAGTVLRVARPGGDWREIARWRESLRNVMLPGGAVATQLGDTAWQLQRGQTAEVLVGVVEVIGGPSVGLLADVDGVWRITGGHRRLLTDASLGDLVAVDRLGNPIVLPDGEGDLAHWSRAGGLRTLLAANPQAE